MEPSDLPAPRPSGSWRTIAVVAVILGLIVLVGYSFVHAARASALSTSCASNQCMIIHAAMTYADDNSHLWPCRPTDALGNPATNLAAIDGFCTAAASLELLCLRVPDGDLLARACCHCPATGGLHPAAINPSLTYATGQSHWGSSHDPTADGGPGRMSYAYDWSAPPDASAVRIMICDRGTLTVAHRMIVRFAIATGGVGTITLTAGAHPPGAHVTNDEFGGPEGAIGIAKESSISTPDDVFDDQGDDGAMMTPAGGSSTRCWVR